MFYTSYIEISKSALHHNLNFLNNHILKNVKVSSVVKGNAYGHGIEFYIPLAESCGINHFSVFSADEAYRVQKASINKNTIMIMGLVEDEQLAWAIENEIEFYVFEFDRLEKATELAKKIKKKATIHIELETGMNRTGFIQKDIGKITKFITKNSAFINFKGLCTHYAGAESITNYYRIKKQQKSFQKSIQKFKDKNVIPEQIHSACSAAALRYPKSQMDMVRLGIVQYGFFPNKEIYIEYLTKKKITEDPLRRIISWKSKVMDVKTVKAGEFVGYGTSYLANSNLKIATIPVGYSHGFSRSLSNQGRVLIHGHRINVIGIVNMNMITVDVTEIEHVQKGDEVVLIGKQGDLEISVSSFSEFSDQVNYELLTRLPQNLPRFIVD
ncbi:MULTISPECIES: alanine racemase [Flavobacteriaceae]|uniref:Alanine racemase n=2 Tax=Flavobacteriaceae TaxID=49546 RepID=A0A4Y8ASC5_9FLAO|nr:MULTISPECIES: alanine racemase [Flavobacteriaceae]TEW73719.1 alanine racemase [Gramella jeungdoensis]GGK36998.1 alanine racemase [Lutibacter litoralis]